MERHVFRMDILGTIMGSIILISFSGFMVYYLILTQNFLNLILIILPLLFLIPVYKRRIIVENGVLYYKKNQVNLQHVSSVVVEHVSEATRHGRRADFHLFLMDKEDNVLVHFDRDYIKGQKQERFIRAMKAVNPDMEIDL